MILFFLFNYLKYMYRHRFISLNRKSPEKGISLLNALNSYNNNNNNYDLVVMLSSHIYSWFSSLFSAARKIMNHISKLVLRLQ
jgi:hypothetical protein